MSPVLQDFLNLLDLEQIEVNLFRGQSRNLGGKSVFGGQVLGQSLVAATRTVDPERVPTSLHAYFLRPGDMAAPIVYDVEHSRDGGSFTWRRVKAIQHGKQIFSMMAQFQAPEPGFTHQAPMPEVPPPEALATQAELREQWKDDCPPSLRKYFTRELAIEFKPVQPRNPFKPEPTRPEQCVWFKAAGGLPDDAHLHQCVLTYASDFNLVTTALLPHGVHYTSETMIVASLDHALWFHQPAKVDDWLLYVMDSPGAQGARGLSRGSIFSRDGTLVASVAQEGLMRDTRHS